MIILRGLIIGQHSLKMYGTGVSPVGETKYTWVTWLAHD